MQALGTKVIIKPLEPDKITVGGIMIPDSARLGIPNKTGLKGTVVSIGEEVPCRWATLQEAHCDLIARGFKPFIVGDTVFYPDLGGIFLTVDGVEYVAHNVEDVIAVL